MSVFTPAQDDLASAIRTLCGPLLQIDPCDPAIYDDGVIIRSHVDNPNSRRLAEAGYRVCASGTRSCLVQPPLAERPDPPMRRSEPVAGVLRAALDVGGRARNPRRHSADVTADRLIDHACAWDQFEPREREALSLVIDALREIAEGQR